MKSSLNLLTFEDTIRIAIASLTRIGMKLILTEKPTSHKTVETNYFFKLGLWSMRYCQICFTIHIVLAMKNRGNVEAAAVALTSLACCMLSDYKICLFQRKQKQFYKILSFLKRNFPEGKFAQDYYGVAKVHYATEKLSRMILVGVTTFIWSYNLFPILEASFRMIVFHESFSYPLPYIMWHPCRTDQLAFYIGINILLVFTAYSGSQYYIGFDAMLFTIVNQICMHFDYLSKRIQDFHPSGRSSDFKFIKEIVQRHNETYRICDSINRVFSNLMFLNFFGAVLVICLVAFLVTELDFTTDLVKLTIYLITSIAEVFVLCSFGDKLIRSSANISQAIYEHDWLGADNSYRKAMVLIMIRAKQPAVLNASHFAIASFQTFRAIMTTAYQFYALVQHMYSG